MENIKVTLENELHNFMSFWDRLVDTEYDGFYGAVDKNNEIIKDAPKGIVYTSRILYSYSMLYLRYKDSKYLEKAKHAYDFMINHLRDKKFKGFYW